MNQHNYTPFNESTSLAEFDHIIIGSGIGGLTAATWLSKAGFKVAVLEKHTVPGGFTHTFKRANGYKWDVGVHYVGNVGENGSVRKFYDFLSNGELKWESMGEVYDVVKIGDDTYEFKAGKEAFRDQFYQYFPNDKTAIDTYLNLIDHSNKAANLFFADKVLPPFFSKTLGYFFRKKFAHFSQQTTLQVLNKITHNKRLIAVLCGQFGNYGLTPKHSSFAAHAAISAHFMEGGYYPLGGLDQVAKIIAKNLEKQGSKIFTQANVTEIASKGNRVKGIMVNKRFMACKSVISNAGVNNTFNTLLSAEARQKCKFNLKDVNPSVGHLCLYVGLNKGDQELQLPKHNLWCFNNDNYIEEFEDVTLENTTSHFAYISFPSAKDSQWKAEDPHKATIQVITMAYHKWFEAYDHLPVMKRGEAYTQLKHRVEQDMLNRLYKLFPQIKGHVCITEVSTPLSTKYFSNYEKGEIYGLEHTPARFTLPFLRFETKIKGLRLTGQDILLVGLTGAMLSGMLCATTILKFKSWQVFKQMAKMT